jgi:hypothetical protein
VLHSNQLVAVSDHERASAPTYASASRAVSGDLTAPVELVGWTVLRALIIAPGLAIAGVHRDSNGKARLGRLALGSIAASSMVSLFALWRSYVTQKG